MARDSVAGAASIPMEAEETPAREATAEEFNCRPFPQYKPKGVLLHPENRPKVVLRQHKNKPRVVRLQPEVRLPLPPHKLEVGRQQPRVVLLQPKIILLQPKVCLPLPQHKLATKAEAEPVAKERFQDSQAEGVAGDSAAEASSIPMEAEENPAEEAAAEGFNCRPLPQPKPQVVLMQRKNRPKVVRLQPEVVLLHPEVSLPLHQHKLATEAKVEPVAEEKFQDSQARGLAGDSATGAS